MVNVSFTSLFVCTNNTTHITRYADSGIICCFSDQRQTKYFYINVRSKSNLLSALLYTKANYRLID